MDGLLLFCGFSVLLVAVSLVAAYLPLVGNVKAERAHSIIALGTGIFLGLLFFMLLPEGLEECEEGGIDTHYAMYALLLGFIVIFVIDRVMKHKHLASCACELHDDDHEHKVVSTSFFIGLAIHAACDGLALAAMFMAGEEVGVMATIGLCIHKFAELFSLSAETMMSGLDKKHSMIRMALFSLITPVAGLLFFLLFSDMEVDGTLGIPLTIAAGTLLYVVTNNMIPESFHHEKGYRNLVLIVIGILIMLAVAFAFPHSH
ncbi:MAG: ZIP family metal transporter [Candidatus Methanomethylophilaceae archaeon]|nr:ZIP family metal transporter [Candidatus Methanomethylophilaceae archaeon]